MKYRIKKTIILETFVEQNKKKVIYKDVNINIYNIQSKNFLVWRTIKKFKNYDEAKHMLDNLIKKDKFKPTTSKPEPPRNSSNVKKTPKWLSPDTYITEENLNCEYKNKRLNYLKSIIYSKVNHNIKITKEIIDEYNKLIK